MGTSAPATYQPNIITPIPTRPPTRQNFTLKPTIFQLGGGTPRSPPSQPPRTVYPGRATPAPTTTPRTGPYCYAVNTLGPSPKLDRWCDVQCKRLGGSCPPE